MNFYPRPRWEVARLDHQIRADGLKPLVPAVAERLVQYVEDRTVWLLILSLSELPQEAEAVVRGGDCRLSVQLCRRQLCYLQNDSSRITTSEAPRG